MKIKNLIILGFVLFGATTAYADNANGRFFLEGDGTLTLVNAKLNQKATVQYRLKDGSYPNSARQKINLIFGVPNGSSEMISLRFISLLDFLQDHFKTSDRTALIKIVSGYRSPSYNEGLRKKGKLAAKTSMHIEGMAADIDMEGVNGQELWNYVRSLNCCGAGYYHSTGIHVDVGNARFWDEKTTKVEQNIGGENKLLLLKTDFDRYQLPEQNEVGLSISRVTNYPVGLKPEATLNVDGKKQTVKISWLSEELEKSSCVMIQDRKTAKTLSWKIPADFRPKGKMTLTVETCEKVVPEMVDQMESNVFELQE